MAVLSQIAVQVLQFIVFLIILLTPGALVAAGLYLAFKRRSNKTQENENE